MALDISPPNFAGAASMAGGGGNLNLTVPGALGLQAFQLGSAQEAARRNSALELMKMRQDGSLALSQQGLLRQQLAQQRQQGVLAQQQMAQQGAQFQQGQIADQNKLAQQDSQFGQSLDMDKRKLGAQEQQLMVEAHRTEMVKLLEDKKETLREKGAFASYARMSLERAASPEEAQQITTEFLKEAVDKGYLEGGQAKNISRMPLSQRKSLLESMIINVGMAKEYKDMNPDPKDNKSGSSEVILPDGTVVRTQSPTTPVTTELQKDLSSKEKDLISLGEIGKQFNENYLTFKGQVGVSASKFAERAKGIPGVEQAANLVAEGITGKSPKERGILIKDVTKFSNSVEQFFNRYRKEITGAAAAESEIARLRQSLLNNEMSPSEFKGALDQLLIKTIGETDYNKLILREGIDVSPKQYKYNSKTREIK